MQARGPLMIEHRLIERMIALIADQLERIRSLHEADPVFIEKAVDFIRTYADRTHHGKEEDILFRELDERPLSPEDRKVMHELVEEHELGRRTTRALVEATRRYQNGDAAALAEIEEKLELLADFYPKHIAKEDKVFFPAARAYLSDDEEQAMLEEFAEFDRKMIHEKYTSLVEELDASSGRRP
jgi:hemerythrin-like domain-containing protein